MPLDIARTIAQTEYDALWEKADECGEVPWQYNDIEQRQTIPKHLGQGETRIIDLHPGLSISITMYQYWRPLHLDYRCIAERMLLSNFYLAGDRRIINPGIHLEEDREKPLVKPAFATSKRRDRLSISQPDNLLRAWEFRWI